MIEIGITSVVADTSRMKKEIVADFRYPTFREGTAIL
jgi:hypothetical protein